MVATNYLLQIPSPRHRALLSVFASKWGGGHLGSREQVVMGLARAVSLSDYYYSLFVWYSLFHS